MTIPALLAASTERFGDHLAIVDGDTQLTYVELRETARTFGAGLVGAGVAPGDRVAIWAPNSARWVTALFGLSSAGAVLVPINTRFKGVEAAEILRRSKARVIVTLKSGVLDPQGQAIQGSLKSLGFSGVGAVRQGKVFDIELGQTDRAAAEAALRGMCEKLLANTVIENYAIDIAG